MMKKARDLLIGDRIDDLGDVRKIIKVQTGGEMITVRFEDGGRALFSAETDIKIAAD